MRLAAGIYSVDFPDLGSPALNLAIKADSNTRRFHGGSNRVEQHAAMDPVSMAIGAYDAVGKANKRLAAVCSRIKLVNGFGAMDNGIQEPNSLKNRLSGRLQENPSADGT